MEQNHLRMPAAPRETGGERRLRRARNRFPAEATLPSTPAAWTTALRFRAAMLLAAVAAIGSLRGAEPAPAPKPGALSASDLSELSLEDLLRVQYNTVSTASRRTQDTREAPASVSIVTAEDIKTFGYQTLGDILNGVRGFYTVYDRNYVYLGTRGFNRPGDYNSRVLVLIDGHRDNDAVADSALIGGEGILDVDLIERVEIVRGPSSSLYGSSAFFGVINLVTRRGRDVDGAEVSGEVGSFGASRARFTAGSQFKSGVEFLLSGTYRESQGPEDLYYAEFDDPATHGGVAHGLDGERVWQCFGSLSYRDFTLSGGYNRREKDLPTAPWGTIFNDGDAETMDQAGYLDLQYQHLFENEWNVMARVAWHNTVYTGTYPYDYANPGDPLLRVINRDDLLAEWVGGEVQASRPLGERVTVTSGLEFRHNFRQDQANFDDVEPRFYYLDDHWSSYTVGAYGQADVALRTNLLCSLGGRYDYYDMYGDTANPRLALIYSPWQPTTFKLLYGQAFRAPSLLEARYLGFGQLLNPDLQPETIRTYEAVWEQQIPGPLRLSLSGYYYDIDDLIDLKQEGPNVIYRNAGQADGVGVEVGLEGRWEGGWLARVGYTAQRAEDKLTGAELSNSPRNLVQVQFRAPIYREKVLSGLELIFVDSMRTVKGGRTEPYWLANWTIFSHEWIRGLEISGGVYNLFDHDYASPGGPEHTQDFLPQNGRTFRVKVAYRF